MGMAASQARLLTLTARLSDVELKAQNIESQKIQLATQEDEVYKAYCDALDATKIQVAFQGGTGATRAFVDANFVNMCTYDKDRITDYSLIDSKTGKVFVTQEIKNMYDNFVGDKYLFALGMMGLDEVINQNYYSACLGDYSADNWTDKTKCMTPEEEKVYQQLIANGQNTNLKAMYDDYQATVTGKKPQEEQQAAFQKFRDKLYELGKADIYKQMAGTAKSNTGKEFPDDLNQDEFNFYVRLFEKIQSAGGCTVIDPAVMSGSDGNEWLNNMVGSGRVTISVYNKTKHEWTDTSLATSTSPNYLQESKDDTNEKKAEAEYQYQLKKINAKDKKFDQDLSKLETERNAITKEIESLKTVRDENVDRTFNIFNS